ncbi:metalloprotease MEP1, partial [Metarhizium majus ARSEF 297]
MHLVSALSANVLALSLAVLSDTTAAAPNRVEEFCDWQPGQELNAVQNTVRRADTTFQETSLERDPERKKLLRQISSPEPVDDGRAINVGVHMHVRTALYKQLDFLNKSFKPANISFTLSSADWTKGGMLARGLFLWQPLAMSLHRGNFSELNIFFCDNDETIGGRSHPVWNLGVTVVHEVGHWFGLWDTDFTVQGDCEPNWRNATGLSNEPCGARCDSNYMSYGADACLTEFTSKQIANMRKFALKKRGL